MSVKSLRVLVFGVLVGGLLPLFGVQAAEAAKKQVKVLAIGNSFSRDANSCRTKLNEADPSRLLLVTEANIGGCSLEKHVKLAETYEKNPADAAGRPYNVSWTGNRPDALKNAPKNSKVSLKELLLADQWEYVTIQQVSHLSDDITTYRPYAKQLCDYIKKYCPKAQIVVHEVWADRVDNARMLPKKKTQADMYRNLHNAYWGIAAELGGLKVIPVGDAFQNVRQVWNFQPDPNFDAKKAVYPALPDQSRALCIGWMWNKDAKTGQEKIRYDHHANQAGRLLAALVWREFFLGADSRQSTYKPSEMSEENAVFLRKIAHETVVDGLKPNLLSDKK